MFYLCSFGIICIVFNRRNFLITMLFIEVMYVGIFISFIVISIFLNDPLGQLYGLALLVTAACESAIGLSILSIILLYEKSIVFLLFILSLKMQYANMYNKKWIIL